jgi:muramoyltetrapeptide carboxypeptidase
MNRRNLLKSALIGAAGLQLSACSNITANPKKQASYASNSKIVIGKPLKPKALQKGDKVGIVAPGTNAQDTESIAKIQEVLSWLELEGVFPDTLREGFGYKTRTPEIRAKELMNMFSNPEIKAIFCVRGGYGSQQILKLLDYDIIRENPKIFAGYSDITALHIAINQKSNLVTFHSPVMKSAFTDFTANHFRDIIFGNYDYPISLKNPSNIIGIREIILPITINRGIAKGQLIGGNLSLVSALIGTPYEINPAGKILFLEDVGEKPYSIDRMLSQLELAGKLEGIKGVVFGLCEDCSGGSSTWDKTLGEVLDYYFKPLEVPAFYGLLFGHTSNQLTLPELGQVELNADAHTLTILENPVEK